MSKTPTTNEDSELSFFKSLGCFVGSPDAIKRMLKFNILRDQPVGLFGRAGIGKTQLLKQVADEIEYDLHVLYLQHIDKEDIAGFPFPDPNDPRKVTMRMKNLVPLEPSKRKGTILFLDEFNRAERPVVNAAFTMMEHPRIIGDVTLPKDVRIVLAGNPSDQNYMVNEIEKEAAIRRRVCWAGMTANHASWIGHAQRSGFHTAVVNYVRRHKTYLYDVEGHNNGRISANPASWEKVSKAIRDAEVASGGELEKMDVELRFTIAGLIGMERMQEFMTELMAEDATHIEPEEILLGDFRPGQDVYEKVEKLVKSKKLGSNGKIGDLCTAIAVTIASTKPAPSSVTPAVAKFALMLEGDNLQKFFENLLKDIKAQDSDGKYLNIFTKSLGEQAEYKTALKRLHEKSAMISNALKK